MKPPKWFGKYYERFWQHWFCTAPLKSGKQMAWLGYRKGRKDERENIKKRSVTVNVVRSKGG